eukprot:7250850-Alexandrium_andersonii.AAC.1
MEVAHRIGGAWAAFRKLTPVWKAPVSVHKRIHVYKACVLSRLTYGLHVIELTPSRLARLDAVHHRMVRIVSGTHSTYASK